MNFHFFCKSFYYTVLISLTFLNCNNKAIPEPEISDLELFVIESDYLLGNFKSINIYHETFVINTTNDNIVLKVESFIPDSLKNNSVTIPAFGRNALIPFDYSRYFDIPNINTDMVASTPGLSKENSYCWGDLILNPSCGIHIPYSNYFCEPEKLLIKKFGTNSFLDLEIISDYSIAKNPDNASLIDVEIKQTILNTGKDTIYDVAFLLHIPKSLTTKPEDTKLYNLISDTVICPQKLLLYNKSHLYEGFGYFRSSGQEVFADLNTLLPQQSSEFTFKMTIEPLQEKFEIYPTYQIRMEKLGKRIFPGSSITVNNKICKGPINYMKALGLSIPAYILFSIDRNNMRVVSPDEIEPTFKP